MPRLKWSIRSCRRLPNIWIRTKTAWSPRRKLLNPSTLKSGGVRDCEKVKEKLDRKCRRGLTFADFYDMITRFASCTSIGKNKAFCFLFLVPDYLLVMWKMLSTTLMQTTTGRSTTCEEVIKEKSPGSIPDVKVNEVFKKVDINNDSYIDIEEFRNTLKSD